MDLLVAEEDLLPEPEEYSRNMELAFWSTEKHEQKRNGYPVVSVTRRPARSSGNFRAWRQNAAMEHRSFEMQAKWTGRLVYQWSRWCRQRHKAGSGPWAAMAAQGKNTVCFTLKQNAQRFL